MSSDIKLVDKNTVEIVADQDVVIRTKDLKIDSAERRSDENRKRPRRALVHNHDDGLTINWKNDYPHGVKIQGHLESTDSAAFKRAFAERLIVQDEVQLTRPDNWPDLGEAPPRFGPEDKKEPRDVRDDLVNVINSRALVNSVIPLSPRNLKVIRESLPQKISLVHELVRLRAEIAHLKERMKSLESAG